MTNKTKPALLVASILLSASWAFAQADVAQWPKLTDQEFVQQARPAWKANKKAPRITRAQITAESVRRLSDTNAPESADFVLLDYMSVWSAGKLPEDRTAKLRQALQARQANTLASNYRSMAAYCDTLSRAGAELTETDAVVLKWLAKQQLSALTIPELESLCARLMQQNVKANRLRVEWNGVIKPEKEDHYRFSLARTATDLQYHTGSVHSEMRVWIDGWKVIDSSNGDWFAQTGDIVLGPNHPKPIRVEFILDRTQGFFAPGFPGIAMLEWKTESSKRELVPASAFFLPEEKGPGLQATYRYLRYDLVKNQEKLVATAEHIEPQIDQYWYEMTHHGLRPNRQHVAPLVEELLKRYITPEHLAARAEEFGRNSGRNIPGWRQTAELMTSAQRQQFMKGLLADPTFVPGLKYHNLKRIYEMIYPGAEEACLDICTRWFQLQPDLNPKLGRELFDTNRELGLLAELIARQAGGAGYLRDRAIKADDGSCRSLAAYTVAWAYTDRGELPVFISWLDEQLKDPKLSGDRRVNWLIIRAHAEAIRATPPGYRTDYNEQPMNGLEYLNEAYQAAESEPIKLRVLREQVFRLYAATRLDQIRELFSNAETELTLDDSKAGIASLKQQIAKAIAKASGPSSFDEVAEKEYLAILRTRAEAAREHADIASLERYKALIKQIVGEDLRATTVYPQEALPPKEDSPQSDEKKPLTRVDLEQAILVFHRRHFLEAYQQHGQRDPKWDLRAEVFLDELAIVWTQLPWKIGHRELIRMGDAAVAAGCTDPLVRFGLQWLHKSLQDTPGIDSIEIARALAERGDGPHLSAYLAALNAERLAKNIQQKENPDPDGFKQSYEMMIEQVGRFLDPTWIQPGEEHAAFEAIEQVFGFQNYLWPDSQPLVDRVVEESKVSPWVGHMFAAKYHHDQAWAGRGGGYVNTVTQDGWTIFRDNMRAASQHLQKAYDLKPEWPEAAATMISVVGTGEGDSSESMEKWFFRTVEAQSDYMEAYRYMFHFLLPRWNGTNELVERVGLHGLRTKKFETMAPAAYYNSLTKLASHDPAGKYAFWRSSAKTRYSDLKRMCEGYEKSNRLDWHRYYFRSVHLGVAWHAQKYEKALELLEELENVPDSFPMADMGINVPAMIEEVHALGGDAGDTVQVAKQCLAEKQWDEAQKQIDEALAVYTADAFATRYLQQLMDSRKLQQELETDAWVELQFDKQLTGWEVGSGTWRRRDAGTIIGRANGESMAITLRTPVGNRYEFRGEIAIPRTKYGVDTGGFFFGKTIYPTSTITSVMIGPPRQSLALQSTMVLSQHQMMKTEGLVRGNINVFQASVWDGKYVVYINGKPINKARQFRAEAAEEGGEQVAPDQFVGLAGYYWYDGPDVLFSKLQIRRLTEPPKELLEE